MIFKKNTKEVKMQIKDLSVGDKEIDIVVEIVDIDEVREFDKFGKSGTVATAKIKDESGQMSLTLWNEQIEKVKVGSKVHIINGYVNEYQEEKQLTTGKFGKLEVVEDKPEVKDTEEVEEENV